MEPAQSPLWSACRLHLTLGIVTGETGPQPLRVRWEPNEAGGPRLSALEIALPKLRV
jgi:hypothetical protein